MRFTTWLVLVATLLLWSGNWIVARAVRDEISPGVATVGRLVLVLAILSPFAWRGLRRKLPLLSRRDWLVLAAHGDVARLSFNVGDLMALASMMMWAGYTVLLRVKRDPLEVIELLCMVCAFGAAFMAPWLLFEAISGATLRLSTPGALAVLYS